MAAQFADLKEFITEVNFLTNISVPTSNLMRFMQDLMNDPSPKALENFQSAYNDRKPLKIAYVSEDRIVAVNLKYNLGLIKFFGA